MEIIKDKSRKLGATNYCFACGKEKNHSHLIMFVPRMETYCKFLEDCENPKKHIETQMSIFPDIAEHQTKLVPLLYEDIYREASKFFKKEEMEILFKMIGKVSSARLNTNQALFVAKYMNEYKLTSINEAFSHIIDRTMKNEKTLQNKDFKL